MKKAKIHPEKARFLANIHKSPCTFQCRVSGASGRTRTYNPSVNRCDPSIFLWQKLHFFYYICATILKMSGRRVCGRFVAENVTNSLPQTPSKRHEYMQGELDLILHMIMQFDPSTICHIKSKGHEESKDDCAKAPRAISREEPFPLPHPSPSKHRSMQK